MRQSLLFAKSAKSAAKDIKAASHRYLIRGDFIDQHASGIYTLLPLGLKVHAKIESIVRTAMNALGAQELSMPALQSTYLWKTSGRLTTIDPPLFCTKDRHGKQLILASTHEEVITALAQKRLLSYKHLPQALFQIQTKYRNEMRATGGLLRVREFTMKDLYSFHADEKDLNTFYERVKKAYLGIFKTVGITALPIEADSGTIGGAESHEFATLTEAGEDTVYVCSSCRWSANSEVMKGKKKIVCPGGHTNITKHRAIENGHIFKLGSVYSNKLGACFIDRKGKKQPLIMGCYGIGIGRLLATIVEIHHDKHGIIWPTTVAPFQAHIVSLGNKKTTSACARSLYTALTRAGIDVLLDDRDESPGIKLNDSDLIGIPVRIIASDKTTKQRIEYKRRDTKKIGFLNTAALTILLKKMYV